METTSVVRSVPVKPVYIHCTVDEEKVVVSQDAAAKSELVGNLPDPGATIQVPFNRSSVAAWQSFATDEKQNHLFLDCIAALKVADFLQDKDTEAAAGAYANRLLFPNVSKPSRVSEEDEQALKSLPEHLSLSLLQAWPKLDASWCFVNPWDRFDCMMHTLPWLEPATCHVMALSSCITESKLMLYPIRNADHIEAFITAAPELASKLRKLALMGLGGVEYPYERLLSPITFLEDLSLYGCDFPCVPGSLTALTSLFVKGDCYEGCNADHEDQFFHCSHLSNLTALQNLSLIYSYIPDFDALSYWLSKLPGLTSFEFTYTDIEDVEVTALAAGLARCPSVQSLKLEFSSDGDAVSKESFDVLRQCVTAFGQLTHLIFHTDPHRLDCGQLTGMLRALPLLQHLDVSKVDEPDEEAGEEEKSALKCLQDALSSLQHLRKVDGIDFIPLKVRRLE